MKRILLFAIVAIVTLFLAFMLLLSLIPEHERGRPVPGETTVLPTTEPEETTAPDPPPESTTVDAEPALPLPDTGGADLD